MLLSTSAGVKPDFEFESDLSSSDGIDNVSFSEIPPLSIDSRNIVVLRFPANLLGYPGLYFRTERQLLSYPNLNDVIASPR